MSGNKLLVLSGEDLLRALPMERAVRAMRSAFTALSEGRALLPPRMNLPAGKGTLLVMPALLGEGGGAAVKVLTLEPENPARGLPLIHALAVLLDGESGRPLAVLEGGTLTALRTGAAAGLATDLLARPEAEAAALFGAGIQAKTQLMAFCAVRKVREARVFDPRRERAEAFAREMSGELGIPVRAAATPAEALRGAGLVSTATTSGEPVFEPGLVEPGTHINAVGAFTPRTREIPGEIVARARVVVDQREACLAEAGDLLLPMKEGLVSEDHIQAELGEVAGGSKPGRTSREEITLFKSVGVAVQDAAAAREAYESARELGLGREVPF